MKNTIKFVYFDIGGVMLRWMSIIDELAKRHNRDPEQVKLAFHKFEEQACRGLIKADELWSKILKELQLDLKTPFDHNELTVNTFEPIIETHRYAHKISKKVRIGLLTNIHHGVFDICFKQGFIPDLNYSVIIQSCLVGLIKPQKEIYQHAQKLAKVPHENILFIDDYEVNLKGAAALGWQTVTFNPDKPVESLKEISALLEI